jgi:hypothetical protein
VNSSDRADRTPFRVTARRVQIGLGLLWLLDGVLQFQPRMFGPDFVTGILQPASAGQPAFIAWPLDHVDHLVGASPAPFNGVFGTMQLLIGIGLLVRDTVKPALVLSVMWSLGVWAVGEGFGMVFMGQASPLTGAPGAVLLYAVIAILVWPRHANRPDGAAAGEGPMGETGARIVWAVLWSAMGVLWLLPANRNPNGVSASLTTAAAGEPGWLSHIQLALAHACAGAGSGLALTLAVVSCWIGVGPLVTGRPTLFLVAGAALSLDFWILGQSFGGILTGLGTDPNAGPLFILLAVAIFPNTTQPAGDTRQPVNLACPSAPDLGRDRQRLPA